MKPRLRSNTGGRAGCFAKGNESDGEGRHAALTFLWTCQKGQGRDGGTRGEVERSERDRAPATKQVTAALTAQGTQKITEGLCQGHTATGPMM